MLLAQEAAAQLGLDRVLFVTTGDAPHKRIEPEPGREVRLELTRAAVAGDDMFEASDLEVRREGPSYSYRTLEQLEAEAAGGDLWFVLGADMAASLERWARPDRVLELARLAVAARPGAAVEQALAAVGRLGAPERAEIVAMPEIGVSSTMIRDRVATGRPVRYLVPERVEAMIAERGLYRQEARV